ncbi:adenylate kinase [candidate division SR1 bacterium]|nr:adenylate kinase [candidate division SR1 bacterium]
MQLTSYVLLGPPCSGKGTQAHNFKEAFGEKLEMVSTGDLLRIKAGDGSEIGNEIASVLRSGKLVSDDLVVSALRNYLEVFDIRRRYEPMYPVDKVVFDGFPRNYSQIAIFESLMEEFGFDQICIVYFKVDDEILMKRLSSRISETISKGMKLREDDNLEIFHKRLEEYKEKTDPMISYFYSQGNVITIDANRSADHVKADLLSKI